MAEEGFEHYHLPQQSRREKLRILSQNQTTFLDSSPTLHSPLPSLYDPSLNISSAEFLANKEERSNLMMRFMNSSCSSSTSTTHHGYLDPEAIQVISNSNCNSNPFLYQPQSLQTIREFNHGYNDGNHEVMVLKPEPLSLSLSSHNKGNQNQNHHPLELNSQRYGSVVVNGGGFGSGGCDNVTRNTVPLGPFTGYASVLKGSRFLKPAQQLLDEICDVGVRGICSEKFTADFSLMETTQESFSGLDDSLGDANNDGRKNESRLLTMLDEVYRRYRQYYQQIHAVVTSFEYVAGLGNAAPFASLAINAMSKHFRCLKNAITDQLQFISKSHFQIDNCIRKDESPRLRNNNGSPYGQRSGFLEHQQPVWRPQRGLPERAVSVLRAWLFEHFLHPYPTDTDKLMLAKQTGLSRNQVSNWFINARVRLWKPMVEEIHMLESQQGQKKPQREERHGRNNNLSDHLSSDNIIENPSTSTENFHDVPYKRSRNELANIPTRGQEQQLIHTNTSKQNQQVGIGMSMAGTNGASNGVSLTLGLHHHQNHGIGLSEPFSLNAAQRFGLALQPDQGYVFQSQNRQFGGQLLHDFVG